jgi:hypothetical protein
MKKSKEFRNSSHHFVALHLKTSVVALLVGGGTANRCLLGVANHIGIPKRDGRPEPIPEICGMFKYQPGYKMITSEVFWWIHKNSLTPIC